MKKQLLVFSSDAINRYGFRISIEALYQSVSENAIVGLPYLINHDFHRPIGWSYPFGLHIQPQLSRMFSINCTAETENDSKQIANHTNLFLQERYHNGCKSHIEDFKIVLGDNYQADGAFFYDTCVSFRSEEILYKIYPDLLIMQDKNGLISLDELYKHFEYLGCGTFKHKKDKFAIYVHQYFRRNLSIHNSINAHFIDEFIKMQSINLDARYKIALDSNIIGMADTYHEKMELEYWWGPKFNNDIINIPDGITRYMTSERECFFSGVYGTEFWWKTKGSEKTLEIEEVRNAASLGISDDEYGCRYIHSIYDITKTEFIHFDGAIRMYCEDKIRDRCENNINVAGKDSSYQKLFRIDGKLLLKNWKLLITNFYHGNPLLYEYFGIKDEYVKLRSSKEVSTSNATSLLNFVPYNIQEEDGVRLFISYHSLNGNYDYNRKIITNRSLTINDEVFPVIEFDSVEIKKALKRLGADLIFPDNIKYYQIYDNCINYPMIVHGEVDTEKLVNKSLSAFCLLFSRMQNSDKIISFSFAWPTDDKEIRVSVFGKVAEIFKWLSKNLNVPIASIEFEKWIEKQHKWIYSNYACSNFDDSFLVGLDGIHQIVRAPIDFTWIKDLKKKEGGFKYGIEFPLDKMELFNLFEQKKINSVCVVLVNEATCSSTGEDYFFSDTSKVLDSSTSVVIKKCDLLGFVWTHPLL